MLIWRRGVWASAELCAESPAAGKRSETEERKASPSAIEWPKSMEFGSMQPRRRNEELQLRRALKVKVRRVGGLKGRSPAATIAK